MKNFDENGADLHRVWLVVLRDRGVRPERASQPIVLEPAEEGTMSSREAARYVAVFNQAAAELGRSVRAIDLPVRVRYEGDPVPGRAIETTRRQCLPAGTGPTAPMRSAHRDDRDCR